MDGGRRGGGGMCEWLTPSGRSMSSLMFRPILNTMERTMQCNNAEPEEQCEQETGMTILAGLQGVVWAV